MPKASFLSLHLARFDALRPLPAQPAAEKDGVLFSALGADSAAAGTNPMKPKAFVFALIGLHADERSARARLDERSAVAPFMDEATENWGAVLRPFRHKGEVNWLDRASPGEVFEVNDGAAADTPFVAITSVGWTISPQLDLKRINDFTRGVAAVRAAATGVPGLRAQQGFGFPGGIELDGITLSFWQGDAAMRAFAYGGGVHKMQMNRYRELDTADRSSFTRAVALETRGSWLGADPLRA